MKSQELDNLKTERTNHILKSAETGNLEQLEIKDEYLLGHIRKSEYDKLKED